MGIEEQALPTEESLDQQRQSRLDNSRPADPSEAATPTTKADLHKAPFANVYHYDEDVRYFENMTRDEFVSYRDLKVDADTSKFIEAIRHAILKQNAQGEFFEHAISLAVLTDDWVLSATEFFEQAAPSLDSKYARTMQLAISEKRKGFLNEGWLKIVLGERHRSLSLLMFSKSKQGDEKLMACLDKTMKGVHCVLLELFPSNHILPPQSARELWDAPKKARFSSDGSDIQEAFTKLNDLRASGVSESEFKAEMQRFRALKKASGSQRIVQKRAGGNPSEDTPVNRKRAATAAAAKKAVPSAADEENHCFTSDQDKQHEVVPSMKRRRQDFSIITRPYVWRGLLVAATLYFFWTKGQFAWTSAFATKE